MKEAKEPLFAEDDKNKNKEEEQKGDLISIKTTKTQKEKRIAREVWFASTILGRIVMTLYSFHGLFFIYNIIIQYIILVPGILYNIDSFGVKIFVGIIYILFAACASNVLVIPTYEFLLLPYLHYTNPFYHLQSFRRVINIIEKELDKEDEEVENENENYLAVNIFLILVEIFYFSSYLLALASLTTKFKDYVKIVILFFIYIYYIMIFLGYMIISVYLIYKFVRYAIAYNKTFTLFIKNVFNFDIFFGDNDKYKERNIGPLPKINLLSYVFHPLLTKAYNIDESNKHIINKKNHQDYYIYLKNCIRIALFFFSMILAVIMMDKKGIIYFINFFIFFFLLLSVSSVLNFPVCFRNQKTFGYFFSGKIKYKPEYKMRHPRMISFVRLVCNVIITMVALLLFFSFFFFKDSDDLPIIKRINNELQPKNQTIDMNSLLLPSICFSYVQNIPLYLYMPFINDAYYYKNDSSFNIENYRRLFFDESYNIEVMGNLINNNDTDTVKMIQYNVKTPQTEVTILSIKGTSNNKDVYMDFQLYIPSILLNILSTFSILGSQKQTYSFRFTEFSLSIPYRLFSTYSVIDEYLKSLTEAYNNNTHTFYKNVIIVGHSLGGGLAKLLGRLLNKQAISLSGPGVNAFHSLWGYEGNSENFEISAVDLVPDMDLVPRVEVSGGTVYRIICKAGPFACHSKAVSLCEVLIMCRNPNYVDYCQKLANLTDIEIDDLKNSSELNYKY
jgi:lipase ATG15